MEKDAPDTQSPSAPSSPSSTPKLTTASSASASASPAYVATTNHLFFALNLPAYVPGEPVDGVLVLVVQRAIRLRAISVAWAGEEFVSWYQGATQSEHCTARRTLVDATLSVWASKDAAGDVLVEGTHTYGVAWRLPASLPAPFEEAPESGPVPVVFDTSLRPRSLGTELSHIRYHATALVEYTVDGDGQGDGHVYRMTRDVPLRVVEPVTRAELVQAPLVREVSSSFLLGGSLRLEVAVSNGGVLFAGQGLFLRVLVRNESARTVHGLTLTLVEHLELSTATQRFPRTRDVLEAAVAQSGMAGHTTWERELMLPIPVTTPPSIAASEHVRRRYEVRVEAEVSLGATVSVAAPVRVLEWSPLLQASLPAQVPVATRAGAPSTSS